MKKSICFVGTDSYPVLNQDLKNEYFGGEAVQQTILAKAFRDFGYEVSMICLDYGQPQGEMREGIRVFKTYKPKAGIPIIRFIYPRQSSVFAALKRAESDIYFQSCAGVTTGSVAYFCKRHSRTFLFRIASDSDCQPGSQIIRSYRDKKIYEYGLRRANIISAQSQRQQSLLAENYSLESHVVNMACDIPASPSTTVPDIDLLWVSNIRQCKRPDKFLRLAREFPERKFSMIGGIMTGEEELFRTTKDTAASIPNLDFLGAVRYQDIGAYFSRSKIFVNTSDIEGFPNTFLQAWSHRIPVISFFDPDKIIQEKMLGISPANFDELKTSVDLLLKDNDRCARLGNAGFKFTTSNYSPQSVVAEYDRLFFSLD